MITKENPYREYIEDDYFRYDVWPEETAEEVYDIYIEIQEELKEYNLQIIDPCIEHDCISGIIKEIDEKHR